MNNSKKISRILVTGAAGFIGYHLVERLVSDGFSVAGLDNFDTATGIDIKQYRLHMLNRLPNWTFAEIDVQDKESLQSYVSSQSPTIIVHLAAKAGVRASLENPFSYIATNVLGTTNVLDVARKNLVQKVMVASSSSVYGNSEVIPFSEMNSPLLPISPYAASKRAMEVICENYALSFQLPIQLFRFFTVYGPAGRPDMAPAIFATHIMHHKPITVFHSLNTERDYTYISDIVDGLSKAMKKDDTFAVYNLGNDHPQKLRSLIKLIETACGTKAEINLSKKQHGDVDRTWGNIDAARKSFGYNPQVSLSEGIEHFVSWLKQDNHLELYRR